MDSRKRKPKALDDLDELLQDLKVRFESTGKRASEAAPGGPAKRRKKNDEVEDDDDEESSYWSVKRRTQYVARRVFGESFRSNSRCSPAELRHKAIALCTERKGDIYAERLCLRLDEAFFRKLFRLEWETLLTSMMSISGRGGPATSSLHKIGVLVLDLSLILDATAGAPPQLAACAAALFALEGEDGEADAEISGPEALAMLDRVFRHAAALLSNAETDKDGFLSDEARNRCFESLNLDMTFQTGAMEGVQRRRQRLLAQLARQPGFGRLIKPPPGPRDQPVDKSRVCFAHFLFDNCKSGRACRYRHDVAAASLPYDLRRELGDAAVRAAHNGKTMTRRGQALADKVLRLRGEPPARDGRETNEDRGGDAAAGGYARYAPRGGDKNRNGGKDKSSRDGGDSGGKDKDRRDKR
ncbi:MAG: hypothetical protein AAF311_16645 [Pseudomonadota bacterium]